MAIFNGSCKGTSAKNYDVWLDVTQNSQSTASRTSNITVSLKLKRNDGNSNSAWNDYLNQNTVKITVNGVSVLSGNMTFDTRNNKTAVLGTWTGNVTHDSDGKYSKVIRGEFTTGNTGVSSGSAQGTFTTSTLPVYSLSISQGTGTTIKVERGGTALSAGTNTLYHGDKLKITFTAGSNYGLKTRTVNNSTFTSGGTHTVSGNVAVAATASAKRNLSISSDAGSSIKVERTSSLVGASTGVMSAGTGVLYDGDKIKITFTPEANYSITTRTVNNSTFTSGGTHTVSGNVAVVATSTPLSSTISATNADIESNTTITVTKYDTSHTNTLTYSFLGLSGTIATKTSATTVVYPIPQSFYSKIPDSKSDICTITCKTYKGDTELGTSSTSIVVTASHDKTKPDLSICVCDINGETIALTGDNEQFIRYKSTPQCSISVETIKGSTIKEVYINDDRRYSASGSSAITSLSDVVVYPNMIIPDTMPIHKPPLFTLRVTDSRGYITTLLAEQPVAVIPYINLSINPTIERVSPTGDRVRLSFNGNFYNGAFSVKPNPKYNELTIQYAYRERYSSGGYSSFSDVSIINESKYITGNTSFRSNGSFELDESFDYRRSYEFIITAKDGNGNNILSQVTRSISLQTGLPIFDWGEHDFNFNVPVNIKGESLDSIIDNSKQSAIAEATDIAIEQIVGSSVKRIPLWVGNLEEGETVELSDDLWKYAFVFFRWRGLITYPSCVVVPNSPYIRASGSYADAGAIEFYSIRGRYNTTNIAYPNKPSFILDKKTAMKISTSGVTDITGGYQDTPYEGLMEIWGVAKESHLYTPLEYKGTGSLRLSGEAVAKDPIRYEGKGSLRLRGRTTHFRVFDPNWGDGWY